MAGVADQSRRPDPGLVEAHRWLEQAEADLAAAIDAAAGAHYNWVCYMAEQAAEKAVKAVYFWRGHRLKRIHPVADLIAGDPSRGIAGVPELAGVIVGARELDRVLTSSRYPDAVPLDTIPARAFSESKSRSCIEWATRIVEAVRQMLPTT